MFYNDELIAQIKELTEKLKAYNEHEAAKKFGEPMVEVMSQNVRLVGFDVGGQLYKLNERIATVSTNQPVDKISVSSGALGIKFVDGLPVVVNVTNPEKEYTVTWRAMDYKGTLGLTSSVEKEGFHISAHAYLIFEPTVHYMPVSWLAPTPTLESLTEKYGVDGSKNLDIDEARIESIEDAKNV